MIPLVNTTTKFSEDSNSSCCTKVSAAVSSAAGRLLSASTLGKNIRSLKRFSKRSGLL